MTNETTLKQEIENIAKQIVMAAVTAPKGRGVETLSYMILNQEDKTLLAKRMDEIAKGSQDLAEYIILLSTLISIALLAALPMAIPKSMLLKTQG